MISKLNITDFFIYIYDIIFIDNNESKGRSMYIFKENISIEEYNNFCSMFSKAPITQDYRWAKVKNNWDSTLCGLYKEKQLVAVGLLLIKKLPLNIKMIYSPKGFLLDYENKEVLESFTDGIKTYAKKIKAYLVKIDPLIAIREEYMDYVDGSVKEDIAPKNYSLNNEIAINNLKAAGYIHKGFKKELSAYIQPRFNMAICLVDKNNNNLTEEQLLNNFKRNARRYYGDFQEKRGVKFLTVHNNDYIDEFCRIINSTAERQNIALRDKTYFERIMNAFKEDAYMFLAQVNIDKYLIFLDNEISNENDEEKKNKLINQKIDAISKKEKYGNEICIATTLAIIPPNKEGIKKVEYLYAGTDENIFPHFNSNASVHIYSFIKFLNLGYHYADLEGVDGSLDDHLSKTKVKYNPILLEFIGEYDLPIKKGLYYTISIIEPILKKLYRFITRLKNKK